MKQPRKATVAAITGLAGLVMIASQSLAAGDHRTAPAGGKGQFSHMSQGGGGNMQGYDRSQRRMGPGTGMGSGTMAPGGGPGQGMMGAGGMMGPGGMISGGSRDHGFGKPITPMTHLSVEDVQHALQHRLERRDNKRLKIGSVEIADDDTIVIEIVTLDDSLVRRLEIDRHTGRMQRTE